MNDCSICLKQEKPLIAEIRDIFSKTPDDTSDIIGKLKSVEEAREILWGTLKKECQLKNALLVSRRQHFYQNTVWTELFDQVQQNVTIESDRM